MKKRIVEKLETLKQDSKYLMKKGDVFVYKIPFEDFYHFGLVLGTSPRIGSDEKKGEFGTIAFYNIKSKNKNIIPKFKNEDVIVYDISRVRKNKKAIINTSLYPGRKGYFETVGNIKITKDVFDFTDFCFGNPQYDNMFGDIDGNEIKPNIFNLGKLDPNKYNREKCFPSGVNINPELTVVEALGYVNPLPKDYDYILDLDDIHEFLYSILDDKINFQTESKKILEEYLNLMNMNKFINKELEGKVLVILEIFAIANKGKRKNILPGLIYGVKNNKIKYNKEEKEKYLKIIDYMLNSGNSETDKNGIKEEYRQNGKKAMLDLKERLK